MAKNNDVVTLALGGGGKQMSDFIKNVVLKNFDNEILENTGDASYITTTKRSAFTTDSFVVKPEFFNGGNIGKLSVCGTVNDLAVSGAIPKYLSFGLIVAEGYPLDKLEEIIKSAAETAKSAGVRVVCGDTKVIERSSFEGVIINTAGVGEVVKELNNFSNIKSNDVVIVTSDIARHGMSVMLSRSSMGFSGNILSDCACLNKMLDKTYEFDVKFIRDATRGGLAAVLNEISEKTNLGFEIYEKDIPLRQDVASLCETLGFDPLSVANEGVALMVTSESDSDKILDIIKRDPLGERAAVIGKLTMSGRVVLKTTIGGSRYVEMPPGELLPRIC